MKVKGRVTLLNMISGLTMQIVTVLSGFIVPKIILSYFGSGVNGLVSSLSQFLSYISLVEGGITGVVMANLYKPLIDKDNARISSVVKTSDSFFRKIAAIFIVYAFGLSFVYPLLKKTGFNYWYVVSLSLILSISLYIQYMFSLSLRTLLIADKKVYIVNFTHVLIIVLNIVLVYCSVLVYPSIHILKLISGLLFIIQPVIFNRYVKKHYSLEKNVDTDDSLVSQRWNGFAINVAAFIHYSTDIAILTIFSSLEVVSVYSVYALVTSGIRGLISSVASGMNPTLGQAYAKQDSGELHQKIDLYEYVIFTMVCFTFTVAGLLITPFVVLYTKGVNDANYNQPLFGYLIVISEALYLIKFPHLNLAYSANKFKEITIPAYIEAGINIVISIVLVNKLGIVGVAVGTIIAMIYRMVFHIYYTRKIFPERKQWMFYKKLLMFSLAMVIGIIECCFLPIKELTIPAWIVHAIIYSVIIGINILIVSVLFFKKELIFFKKYISRRNK